MSEQTTPTPETKPEVKKPELQQACPPITASLVSEVNWLFEKVKVVPMPLDDHQRCQRVLGQLLQHIAGLEEFVRKS